MPHIRFSTAGLLLLLAASTTGCATKRYGRMQPVNTFERQNMDCYDIDLEIARSREFIDQIEATKFGGRDVLAILGDFGIGNMMERSAAIKSGKERLEELENLRVSKACP